MWVRRHFAIAAVALVCGCIADPTLPGAADEALAAGTRLWVRGETTHVPAGGDGAARLAVTWIDPGGGRAPVQLDVPAIAAVPWGEAAAVLDEQRVLWRVARSGAHQRIAGDVAAPPAVGDGGLLAYVVTIGDAEVAIRVRRDHDGGEQTLARGLGTAGLLRFASGRLLLVGAVPGGVAGVWSIDLADPARGARCHTNCELRAGRPWGDAFVPPPGTVEELVMP